MRTLISSYIRRLADLIEIDDTPTEEETRKKRLESDRSVSTKAPGKYKQTTEPKQEKIVPTERPHIKPPRRRRETEKKWNEADSPGLRKEYMREYRQTGKDMETTSTKSKYVKKPKMKR